MSYPIPTVDPEDINPELPEGDDKDDAVCVCLTEGKIPPIFRGLFFSPNQKSDRHDSDCVMFEEQI